MANRKSNMEIKGRDRQQEGGKRIPKKANRKNTRTNR
jgi:hypothetical protein